VHSIQFPYKYNSEFFLRKIGVLLWIFPEINLGKIPRKFSDIFMEKIRPILGKFQLILGKIPRNFSILTPRIFCFTGHGSSEELILEKFLGNFPTYSRENSDIF
jgi:hypothetical protein